MTWWWVVAVVAGAAGLGGVVTLARIVATRNRHPRHRRGIQREQ